LRVIDDAAWVRTQLEALTQQNEAAFPESWAMSDAPEDFTEKLIEAVVGIEMVITRLIGKWKVSQNQPPQNQRSVIQGLNAGGQSEAVAMAAMVSAGVKNVG
jgi:transcriptional regulator